MALDYKNSSGIIKFCFLLFFYKGVNPIFRKSENRMKEIRRDILRYVMLLYARGNLPAVWIFQHDKHISKLTRNWLGDNRVLVMERPIGQFWCVC